MLLEQRKRSTKYQYGLVLLLLLTRSPPFLSLQWRTMMRRRGAALALTVWWWWSVLGTRPLSCHAAASLTKLPAAVEEAGGPALTVDTAVMKGLNNQVGLAPPHHDEHRARASDRYQVASACAHAER